MPSFELDPFQKEALEKIDHDHSLLVSAPTGSGKTVIAEYAIDKALSEGKTAIYTAPIKALSNQKFRDFRARFGEDKVGIVTGDVSLNPQAPVLVMTTEIYRNSLFENSNRLDHLGWVIFDEIHYIDDPERGTVWEEAIMFTPDAVRLLALSATVPNIQELADWMNSIRKDPLSVICENQRPVPLRFYYQCQGRIFKDRQQLRQSGYRNRENWSSQGRRRRGEHFQRARPNRVETVIDHLIHTRALPVIYFAFGRKRTEFLANLCSSFRLVSDAESRQLLKNYDEMIRKYNLEGDTSAAELRLLVELGIAHHHAGMLPTLKEVVEQLFTSRLLKLIFTTETFALGINMPARSVVFDDLQKFYGAGFKDLSTRDFYQMAGRAGRRGLDDEGFVYLRVNPHYIAFPSVLRMTQGKPESIESQLNTAYATLLHLYRDLGQELVDIYPRTLHHFQSREKGRRRGLGMIERKLELLREMGYIQPDKGLTQKGEFASSLFGYELILSEMFSADVFEDIRDEDLGILLSALIFEPRKGDQLPHLDKRTQEWARTAEHYHRFIYRREHRHGVKPYTKPPHFHLAPAVQAWVRGKSFDEIFRYTNADEGTLVRYFRMVVQLARELLHAKHVSPGLKATASRLKEKINRDVVDAEKQLRV